MHGKMYRKVFLVCLLALAGTTSVFFAGRGPMRPAVLSPNAAPIRPYMQPQDRPVRIASALAGDLIIRPGHPAENLKSPARLTSPGLSHVSIPMTFEPNVGQLDAPVEYMGRGRGLTVFLTRREIAVRVANSRF